MATQSSCTLSSELWDALGAIRSAREYAHDAELFIQGRPASGIYVVESGAVRVLVKGRDQEARILEIAGPGRVLGLSETLVNQPYKVTAEAAGAVRASFVPRREFVRFLRDNHGHCLEVVQLLSQDLHGLYAHLLRLTSARGADIRCGQVDVVQ